MRVEVARVTTGLRIRRPRLSPVGGRSLLGPWDPTWAEQASPYLRTPSRLYQNVAASTERRLESLFEDVRVQFQQLRDVLPAGVPFSVEVVDGRAVEAGPLQVRGTIKNAVLSVLGGRVDPERPHALWTVRRREQTTLVSLDLHGALSHRGYRRPGAAAPLRENLAAQMVALSGWHPDREPLVDPMAGTGTLVLEAYGWAKGQAARGPGSLPDLFPDTPVQLWANEPDPQTHRELRATLDGAGSPPVQLHRQSAQDLRLPPGPGWMLVNPPYGERLPDPGAMKILAELWERHPSYHLGLLVPRSSARTAFEAQPASEKAMPNGPLDTHFVVYAGSIKS